ncbi:MAG: hypothetical protein ACRBBP_08220 [Bdellovibrionales bacterium]
MKSLIFLFTIVLSASTFAAEEKLELFCTSPDASPTLFLNMSLQNDGEVALGQYMFQATSDSASTLGLAFNSPKSITNNKNVFLVTLSNASPNT